MNIYSNFPAAKFNVAGLFVFSDLLITLKKILMERYRIDNIKEIYGSPNLLWNGGRVLHKVENIAFEEELKKVSAANLQACIIFSNPRITEAMLKDEACNELLELAFKYNAKFIVSSDLLLAYIKEKYPEANIKISLIKISLENTENSLAYYKNLEEKFENYVLHPDDNLNFDLLKKLDKNKIEILLNERCAVNCPNRTKHYLDIAKEQASFLSQEHKKSTFLNCCDFIPEIKQLSHNKKNISLSLKDVNKIYDLGYRNFKLQGRTDNIYAFCFDLLKYILVSEEFYNFYPIFCFYIEKYLKEKKF